MKINFFLSRKFQIILLLILMILPTLYWQSDIIRHIKILTLGRSAQTFQQEPGVCLTIFVHGSFGSLLGFMSASDVLNDKVSGTAYRKLTRNMRDDEYFYKDQAILQRGLIRIKPTFDIAAMGNKKLAVYPLAQAYETVEQTLRPGQAINYYYTFGWSGLMSQNSRRFEAVRLYNALTEELEKFKKQNITPKIRLITHSHGGNLCLNLAAIHHLLASSFVLEASANYNSDERDSLNAMLTAMKDLPSFENSQKKKDQKVLSYVPTNKNLVIDELVMFGTPIQPETEFLSFYPIFKNVFNFYSEEDLVQRLDWVTSKRSLSNQRLNKASSSIVSSKKSINRVVQAKIMTERQHDPKKMMASNSAEPTVLEEVLAGRNIFVRGSKDPTHKELWFVSWLPDDPAYLSFLVPFPVLILTPMLIQVLNLNPTIDDAGLHIFSKDGQVCTEIVDQDGKIAEKNCCITLQVIDHMKKKILDWKPEDLSKAKEFEAITKHLQ